MLQELINEVRIMAGYSENSEKLSSVFNLGLEQISLEDSPIEIRNCHFQSNFEFSDSIEHNTDLVAPKNATSNTAFNYPLFISSNQQKADKVILLFHGLNERSWDKYLTWATYLAENTGQAVLMFPIAFHMNRSPEEWLNPSFLHAYMKQSDAFGSDKSNFANAALSERLKFNPKQFFISGVQTIQDVVSLMDTIREGKHPHIRKNANINLFGYSIGAFLAQILIIANPKSYFKNSKLMLFCGGPTFDQMNGISKYIMNKDAFESLRALFLKHRGADMRKRLQVNKLFKVKEQYAAFKAMIRLDNSPRRRERRFRQFSKQIYAICLLKDVVMPAVSVMNTLTGKQRDIPIPVDLMDFNYAYSHENPFPLLNNGKQRLVDKSFETIFSKVAGFYNR